MKTCANCQKFIASPHNPAQGAGMCAELKERLDACGTENRKPKPEALEAFYRSHGGAFGTGKAIFWPDSDRSRCRSFQPQQGQE